MKKKPPSHEPNINHHLFTILGFEMGTFQNMNIFIDESEDEDLHEF